MHVLREGQAGAVPGLLAQAGGTVAGHLAGRGRKQMSDVPQSYWLGWRKSTLKKCAKIRRGQSMICPWCGELHPTYQMRGPQELYISCLTHKHHGLLVALKGRVILHVRTDAYAPMGSAIPSDMEVVFNMLLDGEVQGANRG